VKRRDLIKYLQSHGCFLVREGGNHSWWSNAERNRRSSIPRHNEVNDFLARKICRDLGVSPPPRG
jgi:mRNA interferase HicA